MEMRAEALPPTTEPIPWWVIAVPIVVAVLLLVAVFVVLYIVSMSTYIPTHVCNACAGIHSFGVPQCVCT